jgi:hypothetical protein
MEVVAFPSSEKRKRIFVVVLVTFLDGMATFPDGVGHFPCRMTFPNGYRHDDFPQRCRPSDKKLPRVMPRRIITYEIRRDSY